MEQKKFIAIDLGATSGRVMLATMGEGRIDLRTVSRFHTPQCMIDDRDYWELREIWEQILSAIKSIRDEWLEITSIGVDTWGVDFVRADVTGGFIEEPRAYRDPYTDGIPEVFFREFPREGLFRRTGIQIMNFNSVFQLYAQKKIQYDAETRRILFLPDAIGYLLARPGADFVTESTILSTSGLADAKTGLPDPEICAVAGVTPEMFGKIVEPGYKLGYYRHIPVITVAGHDTASAVAAVPAWDEHFAYLSSGTWSLMGIEVPSPIINEDSARENFTNERGIEGTTRFLKNITGMWLLEQCKDEWQYGCGRTYSYQELQEMALREKDFPGRINPDDPRFAHTLDMVEAIAAVLDGVDVSSYQGKQQTSYTDAQIVSCIYHSLADRYAEVLEILRGFAPFPIERLHIIGGGSANDLLNQWTADAIGIPVFAGPMEATVLGNVMVQAKAAGLVHDRWEMRRLIAKAFPLKKFLPKQMADQVGHDK